MNLNTYEQLDPEERVKSNLAYHESQLSLRDKYIEDNAEYLDGKCKDIGLNDKYKLGELCFVLSKRDDLDNTGDLWTHTYMIGAIFHKLFIPHKQRTDKLRCLEVLIDVLQTPLLVDRLNISFEDGVKLSRELMASINDTEYQETISMKPKRKTEGYLINRLADELFVEMSNQINPPIPAKIQIPFVMGVYSDFKYWDYHMADTEGNKYKRLETQRTRAI